MSERIQSVDVEAIMAEIREKIKERGYTQEMLSFDEAMADAGIENGSYDDFLKAFDAVVKQCRCAKHF